MLLNYSCISHINPPVLIFFFNFMYLFLYFMFGCFASSLLRSEGFL